MNPIYAVVITALFFVGLIGGGWALWHKSRRERSILTDSDARIAEAADIAQRRYRARFGREDTGLQQTLANPAKAMKAEHQRRRHRHA